MKKEVHELKWFLNRIGYQIYKSANQYECDSCKGIVDNNIIIHNREEATDLFNSQETSNLYYFDEDIQFPHLQLFRKRYLPGEKISLERNKIWEGYKMTKNNEYEIINWSNGKIKRSEEVDYENGIDIYWLLTITHEWYDVIQSRNSVTTREEKLKLDDYIIEKLPNTWQYGGKDDYTIVESQYINEFLQELIIK